jgi:hypothetical protein
VNNSAVAPSRTTYTIKEIDLRCDTGDAPAVALTRPAENAVNRKKSSGLCPCPGQSFGASCGLSKIALRSRAHVNEVKAEITC